MPNDQNTNIQINNKNTKQTSKVDLDTTMNNALDEASKDISSSQEPSTSNNRKNSKEKDSEKQDKSFEEVLRYYLGPLILLIISFVIIFTIVLPLIQDIMTNMDEVEASKTEFETLQNHLLNRQKLTSETNNQKKILEKINELIPQTDTAVVDFSEEIRKKANKYDLEMRDQLVGEVIVIGSLLNNYSTSAVSSNESGNDQSGVDADNQSNANNLTVAQASLDLVELPAEFTLAGEFNDIKKFLGDIYGGGDFIIIKKMELQQQAQDVADEDKGKFLTSRRSTNWVMSITLVKYQFKISGENTDEALNRFYFNAVPDTRRPDKNVIDFIKSQYGI